MASSSGVGNFCDSNNSTNNFPDGSNSIYGSRQASPPKKRRSLPGNPDPSAQVIALSPKTLMETNRFLCEICKKGFKRDQNLQLHLRGHNLPYKLRVKPGTDQVSTKKVYVCPEPTCVHHDPSRALGDLTGIKKHFFRKHGHKRWECDKCSKKYAVESDWRYHSRNCGTGTRVARVTRVTKEYKCQCGAVFPSRRQCFVTHGAFCEAREESKTPRVSLGTLAMMSENVGRHNSQESGKLVVSRGPVLMIPATSGPMSTTTAPTRSTRTSDHRDSEIPNLALASQEEPPSKLLSPPPRSSQMVNNVSLSLRSTSALEEGEANHHRHPHGQPISDHLSFNELIQKATEMSVTRRSRNNYSSGIITMVPSKDGEFSRYDGHNNISSVQESSSHYPGASDGNTGMFSRNPIGSSVREGEDIVTFDFLGIGIGHQ